MKKDAKIAEKFKDFTPTLDTRAKIVLGMGLRGFEKCVTALRYVLIAIGVVRAILPDQSALSKGSYVSTHNAMT